MPKIQYREIKFSASSLEVIARANDLIAGYQVQGYVLTLRQLYYQFVARAWLRNQQKEYKRLGSIINDARLAGLIDWEAIEDRTRSLGGNGHWESPESIINACAGQFMIDKWEGQDNRVEVWVEKDALEGVVGKAAREMDVSFFSCRGYTSQTSMWEAGSERLQGYAIDEKEIVILHLGDHDPSGIDMSRDIEERLRMFLEGYDDRLTFRRIALNKDQIKLYNPPPNPAKIEDSRYDGYVRRYGEESWELDALEPQVIHNLIVQVVGEYRDEDKYAEKEEEERVHKELLELVASQWDEVTQILAGAQP